MQELRIPFALWLQGDPLPRLGTMIRPAAFPIQFIAESGVSQLGKDELRPESPAARDTDV